jgi:ectoine hydroxylase-related dioxygenase (phytanoyl-CoA dioxygenase family)
LVAAPKGLQGSSSRQQARPRQAPSTPWIESDGLGSHLERIGADAETTRFAAALSERGYAIIDLGDDGRALCDQAVAQTEPHFADGKTRVQDAWRRDPAVRALARLPKISALLSAVYGRKAFPFQTLNFQRGSQQGVHADTIHFHSEPAGFMCGVWIALEDIEPGCGPLTYYPGSHKLPVMTMRGAGVNRPDPEPDDYVRHYLPAIAGRLDLGGFTTQEALLTKGQALVWVANLSHGGAAITRPESTRRSLVVHFFFEDCVYHTPMWSDVEGARLHVRIAANVKTGGWTWPRRNGWPVAVSARTLAIALSDTLGRKVHRF